MPVINEIAMLDSHTLRVACEALAASDEALAFVFEKYGTPPLWERPRGFATLIHIILEQQVSLASAKACFEKLNEKIGDVTPASLLKLDDIGFKVVGFSRQKTAYARHLAAAIAEGRIDLERLASLPDAEVKSELMKLNGVGQWTADIYLLMALLRPDIMPKGDLALHVAHQMLTNSASRPGADEFITIAEKWRPYRSVAARLLWHFYLSERRKSER